MATHQSQADPAQRYQALKSWLERNGASLASLARQIGMDRRNLARALKAESCSARTIGLCRDAGVPEDLLPPRHPEEDPAARYQKLKSWLAHNNLTVAGVARQIGMDRRNLARALKAESCAARTIALCREAGVPEQLLPEPSRSPVHAAMPGPLRQPGPAPAAPVQPDAAPADPGIEARLEAFRHDMEERMAQAQGELMAALQQTVAESQMHFLDNLLVEVKKIFENFDYLKYQIESLEEKLPGEKKHLSALTGFMSSELNKLEQRHLDAARQGDELGAQQQALRKEVAELRQAVDAMQEEFAEVKPTLKQIATHSESLTQLLKSAIQKMTRLKVSGF
jgi:AraC-like DNA-binding protein